MSRLRGRRREGHWAGRRVLAARGARLEATEPRRHLGRRITAALIAAGYSASELKDIIFGLDFRQFEDKSWEDRIPGVGKGLSVLVEEGVFKGDAFLNWMRKLLADKGVHTFADLKREWTGRMRRTAPACSAAETFLQTWNFEAYIEEFRKGKTQSRRADIAAELEQAVPAAADA